MAVNTARRVPGRVEVGGGVGGGVGVGREGCRRDSPLLRSLPRRAAVIIVPPVRSPSDGPDR